ncbi:MAG: hypothetical protein MGG11_08910 [Trichodesmium sp. MAG_R03]|jgi:hypothetical protein|nr:hypothetical protein [Trichodesmium sp. MAG_R03]
MNKRNSLRDFILETKDTSASEISHNVQKQDAMGQREIPIKKLIYVNNRSVVPPVCYAAKRNPWFAQNIHATNFFCSIELIYLIC